MCLPMIRRFFGVLAVAASLPAAAADTHCDVAALRGLGAPPDALLACVRSVAARPRQADGELLRAAPGPSSTPRSRVPRPTSPSWRGNGSPNSSGAARWARTITRRCARSSWRTAGSTNWPPIAPRIPPPATRRSRRGCQWASRRARARRATGAGTLAARHWSNRWSTPQFRFFRDGRVVASLPGWTPTSRAALLQAGREQGLLPE